MFDYFYLFVFWIFVFAIFGVIIYYTKLILDKRTHYNDAEKAGIYVGVSIAALIFSYTFATLYLLISDRISH